MPSIEDAVQQWNAAQLTALGEALVTAGIVAPPGGGGGGVGGFDTMRFASQDGATDVDGSDPSKPATLEHILANHQVPNMLIVVDGGAPHTGTLEVTESNVTIAGRWAGVGYERAVIGAPISIGAGVTRFQAYGVSLQDINDSDSDGRHLFAQCSVIGNRTYSRSSPKNFVVFDDCNFRSMGYTVSGTGSGGTASGGDAFLTGATELGNLSLSTNLHYVKIRGKCITGRITAPAGVFAIVDCPNTEIEASSGPAVSMPAGMLIMQGGRINDQPGTPGTVTVAQSRVLGVMMDADGSSFGARPAGTTGAHFDALQYKPEAPADWSGTPPTTIQEAIDRLAAANPGA